MRKIVLGVMVIGMCLTCLACSGRAINKTAEGAKMSTSKVDGLHAKLISICFSDFEQTESKEYVLDVSRFDVIFEESADLYTVTFVFHDDGSDRAGGRSKWGRDIKYEITKSKLEIIGKKFFK